MEETLLHIVQKSGSEQYDNGRNANASQPAIFLRNQRAAKPDFTNRTRDED